MTSKLSRSFLVLVLSVVAMGGAIVLATGAGAVAGPTIALKDNYFDPKEATVKVGDTVTWKWEGSNPHDVVVKAGPKKFKSKVKRDGTYTRKITKPGKYRIVCTLHSGMEMTLRATAA